MRCKLAWVHKSQTNPSKFIFYYHAFSFQTREPVIRRADVSQDEDLHLHASLSACWELVVAGVSVELMPWCLLRADEDGSAGREVTKVNGLEKEGG